MTAPIRVTWQTEEGLCIIADRQPGGQWEFSDQFSGEPRWFPLESTPALIATADQKLARQTNVPGVFLEPVRVYSHPVPLHCRPQP